jgi:acid phosphatase type 7
MTIAPRLTPLLARLSACAAILAACERQPAGEKQRAQVVSLGPWLTDVQPGQVTVAWTTQGVWLGEVRYGQSGQGLAQVAREEAPGTDHRLVLTGLQPGQRYDYRIVSEIPAGGTFLSAPDPAANPLLQPFSVLIYGDNRTNGGDHALVARAAAAQGAALALHTGDMVVNAKDQRAWERWFEVESDLLASTPFYPTVGNHEITDKGVTYSRHFQQKQRPTFRSVDYGNVHVQVLDSFELAAGADPHKGAVSDAQIAWAEADARSVPKATHLWLLVHQGPYTHPKILRGGHGGLEDVRRLIKAVSAQHPVEAVFAGHEHFYERGISDGLQYFVIGGGGAPLEDPEQDQPGVKLAVKQLGFVVLDVCGCHVTGRALDIAGKAFDSFELAGCSDPCAVQTPSAVALAAFGPPKAQQQPEVPAAAPPRGSAAEKAPTGAVPGNGGQRPAEQRQ